MEPTGCTFSIRSATSADVEPLTWLRVALLRESGHLPQGDSGEPPAAAIRRYLQENLPSGGFRAWVAEAEGRIVGSSGLIYIQKPPLDGNLSGLEAYVLNMYTVPEWRGRGIASALLREILAHVRTTAAVRVRLHATEEGARVYRRFGFQPAISEMTLELEDRR